ncbi:MAG: hypothetical protein BGO39_30425 [Chloroflexi bacterium 54-19]|nr:MAG: hypothetical protein BGO39_30425 [Chloroflexi bacterium 54-19]
MGALATLLARAKTPDIKAGFLDSCYGDLDRGAGQTFTTWTGLPGIFYPGIKMAAQRLFSFDISQSSPEKVFAQLGNLKVFLIHG